MEKNSSNQHNQGSESEEKLDTKHFVLVHGACHGAWCWYKVETLLKSAGHKVTALDMATCGINPKQVDQVQSISDYFEPLTKFMEAIPIEERVILVAHSYGGLGISMAMEGFPDKITVAVFVCAAMPGPSFSASTIQQESSRRRGSQMDNRLKFDDGFDKPPTSLEFGPNYLASILYQLCSPEDLTLATKLVRPMNMRSGESESQEINLSNENYGSISRVFIVTEEDKAGTKDFQLWMIKNNPVDQVKEIARSDHMVMLSRSQELCVCLKEIAEAYC
ncbi:hypothetical protein IFM89_032058 [Coptis chinensis]|uniref:AB hydrolase-1 domain-containing protein n=1 Tax=Coptis chinensis TaxID=261450 RepID=A0A835I6M3_9MAGN|nr:hypothetical protein IFM89_032058 [Coptis chinensis]